MVAFTPLTQPRDVGSGGAVFQVQVDKGFEGYPIVLLEVEQLAGRATHATVEFSVDPVFANQAQRIATFEGLNKLNPVAHTNGKFFYSWDAVPSSGIIYCRITPETGIDNDYDIRIHFDEEVTP